MTNQEMLNAYNGLKLFRKKKHRFIKKMERKFYLER